MNLYKILRYNPTNDIVFIKANNKIEALRDFEKNWSIKHENTNRTLSIKDVEILQKV